MPCQKLVNLNTLITNQLWVFFISRTYLSPFTRDIRGEDQWDESQLHFWQVLTFVRALWLKSECSLLFVNGSLITVRCLDFVKYFTLLVPVHSLPCLCVAIISKQRPKSKFWHADFVVFEIIFRMSTNSICFPFSVAKIWALQISLRKLVFT